jgi:hypothetical protein
MFYFQRKCSRNVAAAYYMVCLDYNLVYLYSISYVLSSLKLLNDQKIICLQMNLKTKSFTFILNQTTLLFI